MPLLHLVLDAAIGPNDNPRNRALDPKEEVRNMPLPLLRYALVLISLGGLVSAIACGGDDDEGDNALEIVRLEHEDLLFYNGDRLPLTVHWTGSAEFPVTVSLSVREGDCPKDVNCVDEQHEISDEANPIVVPEALWCTGAGDAITVPWDVTIEDAKGEISEPAQMEYTCRS